MRAVASIYARYPMLYEVVKDRRRRGVWRAEAFNVEGGEVYVVIFSGPDSRDRADEYAAWKNGEQEAK